MKHKLFQVPLLCAAIIGICLFCCAYKKTPANSVANNNTKETSILDSLDATTSITGFLRWYKTNLRKTTRFNLLPKSSKGYYVVDAKACAGYLNFLKSSHFIAPKYIRYWQTYFHDQAAVLAKEKLRSDIPEGFDMDLVLLTQEPELILDHINKLTFNVVSLDRDAAVIGVKLPSDSSVQYQFEMYKNKTWQIGYISTPNFD